MTRSSRTRIRPSQSGREASPRTPTSLIIGCGPAGLVLAAQMANFPDIRTVVIDRKDGPLEVGQADGVACRTVEMFEAFGLADRLVNEGYWVNEVAFWRPDPQDRTKITRTGRIQDIEEGLSELPARDRQPGADARLPFGSHGAVGQQAEAVLRPARQRHPDRHQRLVGVPGDGHRCAHEGASRRPARPRRSGPSTSSAATARAAAPGPRSAASCAGDPMNESWGVMDVLAVTDFPDIRLKCAIHSANQGNILIIPREGGYLVRLYIELDDVRDKEMLENRSVTPEKLAAVANRILAPVHARSERRRVVVGVRDRPAAVRQVRRRAGGGDGHPSAAGVHRRRCLPHAQRQGRSGHERVHERHLEPRAGSWPPSCRGRPGRSSCTPTRTNVRRSPSSSSTSTASSPRCSAPTRRSPATATRASTRRSSRQYFITQGRFTAGVATRYGPSMITAEAMFQHLAEGFPVGMRFHSAPVVRLADAKPVHLGHAARADGAWRIYIFADRSDPTGATPTPGSCASSWRRTRLRSRASRRRAPTPTR